MTGKNVFSQSVPLCLRDQQSHLVWQIFTMAIGARIAVGVWQRRRNVGQPTAIKQKKIDPNYHGATVCMIKSRFARSGKTIQIIAISNSRFSQRLMVLRS